MDHTRFRRIRVNLLVFLSVLGPGIITANVDNDPGGIYTYSVAGAKFGYSLLWSLIPITIALVCEGLGLEAGINKRMHEAPTFYSLYAGLIFMGALAVLILRESMQVPIILLSQVANGVMLPFVLIFMLRLCNRKDLMGEYCNSKGFNLIAWLTGVVMILLTLLLDVSSLFPQYFPG